MEDRTINLDKIMKISEKEFKKQLSKWLLDKDLSRELQAKLRKNLIQNFNSTRLGKKISAQHTLNQKVLISPLHLILNTLVAEFLYAQNCHYSLSVFCTEIPFQNTLPDFESCTNFRFSEEDLNEIFDAINGNLDINIKTTISQKYIELDTTKKVEKSCLYAIFDTVFKNLANQTNISFNEKRHYLEKNQKTKRNLKKISMKMNKKRIYRQNNFKFLKKYVVLLTKKLKDISMWIYNLEKTNSNSSINKNIEQFNEKLDKISNLLQLLPSSKQDKNRVSSIILAIDHMSKEFKVCSKYFESILKKNIETPLNQPSIEKSHTQWIVEMKESISGQKFLEKIESSLQKVLEKEKNRMHLLFTEKLDKERKILKQKYKQRYSDWINKVQLEKKVDMRVSDKDEKILDSQYEDLKIKYDDLMTKYISCKCNHINDYTEKNIKDKEEKVLGTTKCHKDIKEYDKIKLASKEPPSRELDEISKKVIQQERQMDNIVFEAKLRIQELEQESLRIDNIFRDYLRKQQHCKIESKHNIESIWENYNLEKNILSNKYKILKNQPTNSSSIPVVPAKKIETIVHSVPQISIDLQSNNDNFLLDKENKMDEEHCLQFENPFRKLLTKFPFKDLGGNDIENKATFMTKNFDKTKFEISNKFLSTIENSLENNLQQQKQLKQSKFEESKNIASTGHTINPIETQNLSDRTFDINHEKDNDVHTLNPESYIFKDNDSKKNDPMNLQMKNSQNNKNTVPDRLYPLTKSATETIVKDQQQGSSPNNIFQLSSFSEDEEMNRILESSQNFMYKPTQNSISRENDKHLSINSIVTKSNSNNSISSTSLMSSKNETFSYSNEF